MIRKVLFCFLLVPSLAQAITITDFGMTFDSVEITATDDLLLKSPKISNPPIPLTVSEPAIDGDLWSANGDPVAIYNPSDPLGPDITISGFDTGLMKITLDVSCTLDQPVVPDAFQHLSPLQWYSCSVTDIDHIGSPTVLGAPIDLDINKMWVSVNGAYFTYTGDSMVPYLASASGTGANVVEVSEPGTWTMLLGGVLFIGLVAFRQIGQLLH